MKPVIVRLLPCLAALALAACQRPADGNPLYRLPEPAPLSAAQPAMPALAGHRRASRLAERPGHALTSWTPSARNWRATATACGPTARPRVGRPSA